MTRRILLVCTLVVFFISACDKGPEMETPTTDTATATTTENGQEPSPESAMQTPVGDKEAGMQLAQKCVECHGNDGNKTVEGSPYLAGQQTDYMLSAMLFYISGERKHEDMSNALQALSETDMLNLATFYNAQTADWKQLKEVKKTRTIAVNKRTIAKGKKTARECIGCHGENGNAPKDGVPALAGLPPEYFRSAVLDYFKGGRREQKVIMKNFKHSVSKSDIDHLAAYFSTQTSKKSLHPAKGNANAGKKLGTKACDSCHGMNGNSGSTSIPSLTGHNAEYLVKALNAYKKRSRKNKMMNDAVATLKNSQIVNLAAHYAKQTPKKVSPGETSQSKGFDPIGQGGSIAATCNGCHGKNGNSTLPGTPGLAGLNPQYLTAAINAYKSGQRKHEMMKSFVTNLSETDVEKVSLYYASQEPTAMPNTLKADAAAGESNASACTACHGDLGNSSQANTPSIAGQEPGYIVSAMNDYKGGKREDENMQKAVAELSNADIKNYAAYFATQTRIKPEVRIPEAPEVLALKCFRCHGDNGISTNNKIPRLAGQLESYLFSALKQYSDETRKQTTMHAMSAGLSPLEQKAIAKYFAQLK